jgi:hypothetical protein
VEGVPLIIVGNSGDRAGNTPLQIWEKVKVKAPASDEEGGGKIVEGFSWLQFVCILLSILFVLENVLVSAAELPFIVGPETIFAAYSDFGLVSRTIQYWGAS